MLSQYNKLLKKISDELLKAEDFHNGLAPAITAYSKFLFDLAQIDSGNNTQRTHINTENGQAIGTFWAASCVKEIFRTQRFVKALFLAVQDKLAEKKEPVQVLYAGTGPFATLALPIMMQFSPEQVQFTLLEINPESYSKLVLVLAELGLERYVSRLEITDATNYTLKTNDIDVLISETMYQSLKKEPQVGIMLNLFKQLKPDTILIPEEIKVTLCKNGYKNNTLSKLATLINFNKALMLSTISKSTNNQWDFEEISIEPELGENERLCYLTELKVYKEIHLNLNDSSLNLLEYIKAQPKPAINFKYSTKKDAVGFTITT